MSDQITDREHFQIAVADALARWQSVEILLQEFFVFLINSPDSRWSGAIYNAVLSLKAKMDMIHEILLWRLPTEELLKEWTNLKKDIFDESKRRNNLVHWAFVATYTETNRETYTYVVTPLTDTRHREKNKPTLTTPDLQKMSFDFGVLQHQLRTFQAKVKDHLLEPYSSPDRSSRPRPA